MPAIIRDNVLDFRGIESWPPLLCYLHFLEVLYEYTFFQTLDQEHHLLFSNFAIYYRIWIRHYKKEAEFP